MVFNTDYAHDPIRWIIDRLPLSTRWFILNRGSCCDHLTTDRTLFRTSVGESVKPGPAQSIVPPMPEFATSLARFVKTAVGFGERPDNTAK